MHGAEACAGAWGRGRRRGTTGPGGAIHRAALLSLSVGRDSPVGLSSPFLCPLMTQPWQGQLQEQQAQTAPTSREPRVPAFRAGKEGTGVLSAPLQTACRDDGQVKMASAEGKLGEFMPANMLQNYRRGRIQKEPGALGHQEGMSSRNDQYFRQYNELHSSRVLKTCSEIEYILYHCLIGFSM